ncbi:serine hydrolase domain-containing protein [Solimonas sp. K1W22B-7]|uniref:serine hydrolase domain-containing protein n=1 Tax=Solimonas sp. K1W22B-7 TaxID=2303331 RepID=UPI0013C3E57D|nr:serine hydrolase domain-containing protein [Solimonas sp. K1W22B-7]
MKNNKLAGAAGLCLALALAACHHSAPVDGLSGGASAGLQPIPRNAPKCAQPAEGQFFPPVDATTLGFNRQRLDEAIEYGNRLLSTSIRVYRYGCLAGESQRDRYSIYVPQLMASASKTVLALSIGRAVTLGHLRVDDPIGKYLPEADAPHGALTVRQLLTQTSGLRLVLADEIAGLLSDPVQQTLEEPFWYEPGSEYMYAQNTLATLSRIVERATGRDFQEFTQQELMAPMGIQRSSWLWLRDRSGVTIAPGGLMMRPDDEARMGHLMLYSGLWNGRQLIDRGYMNDLKHGTKANPGYGYLIWTNEGDTHKGSHIGRPVPVDYPLLPGSPRDAYGAMGALGQMIIAVPSRHMVIVRNGGPGDGLSTVEGMKYKELIRLITDAVDDQKRITDPGPLTYPESAGQFDDILGYLNAFEWNLAGILLGLGQDTLPDCNLILCNGRLIVQDLANFGGDTVLQFLGVVTGSATDAMGGREYSEVIYPQKQE